jgi:hypothetical protein
VRYLRAEPPVDVTESGGWANEYYVFPMPEHDRSISLASRFGFELRLDLRIPVIANKFCDIRMDTAAVSTHYGFGLMG